MTWAARLVALALTFGLAVPGFAQSSTQPAVPPLVESPQASQLPANLPKSIAKLLAKGDGSTREKAIKVKSVGQEYQIIGALGYRPEMQSLIVEKGKAYDLLETTHSRTGEKRTFWFDISSFYGRGFGF